MAAVTFKKYVAALNGLTYECMRVYSPDVAMLVEFTDADWRENFQ